MARKQKRNTPPEAEREAQLNPLLSMFIEDVDRKLELASSGTAIDFDEIFTDAYRKVAAEILRDKLQLLTAEELSRSFKSVLGKTALQTELNRISDLKLVELKRQSKLDAVEQEARIHRRLDLSKLPTDEVLTIGLFDPMKPNLANELASRDRSHATYLRTLEVRLSDPTEGLALVLSDNKNEPIRRPDANFEAIEAFTQIQIGTAIKSGSNFMFSPTLNLHSPFSYYSSLSSKEFDNVSEIIGFVRTGDGKLLLDGSM